MYTCNFCKNTFAAKNSLNLHQRSAKFCLQLQGKESTKICDFCGKEVSTRTVHEDTCAVKLQQDKEDAIKMRLTEQAKQYESQLNEQARRFEEQITQLKFTIEKLNDKLAGKEECITKLDRHNDALTEIAKRSSSTTTHNKTKNIINIFTPLDLSETTVNAILDQHLTTEVIGDGQKGLANMLHQRMLTDEKGFSKYKCTDRNRHHFQFVNADGQVERDTKAIKLTKAMASAQVGRRALTTIQTAFQKDENRMNAYLPKAMELTEIAHNNSKFRQQLACLETCDEDDEDDDDENELNHNQPNELNELPHDQKEDQMAL